MALALSKDNVIMNGFGPQLLLLEIQLGAKGKTKEEIITIAKSSSHQTLITFNDYLKRPESELNDFNTQIASYVASTTKYEF